MITIEDVQRKVCSKFDITMTEMLSVSAKARVFRPRQLAVYIARDITGASLPELGMKFCRDHTTILHSTRKITARLVQDPYLALAIREITSELHAANARNNPIFDEEKMRKAWSASARLTRVSGKAA